MPLPKGTHYRMRDIKGGHQRLAFDSKGDVIEVKDMQSHKISHPKDKKK